MGKLPLVVKDSPGFVVNRLLLTYLNAALTMVIEGVPVGGIDRAMVAFGMPLGPLELLDEIGLDTALQSGVVMSEIFRERSPGTELLVRLVKAKHLGIKSGTGFYQYPQKIPSPSFGGVIKDSRGSAGVEKTPPPSGIVVERLLTPMIAEAQRMLKEKTVHSAWQIDLAVVFGLGFPVERGGLLWWARDAGFANQPILLGEKLH